MPPLANISRLSNKCHATGPATSHQAKPPLGPEPVGNPPPRTPPPSSSVPVLTTTPPAAPRWSCTPPCWPRPCGRRRPPSRRRPPPPRACHPPLPCWPSTPRGGHPPSRVGAGPPDLAAHPPDVAARHPVVLVDPPDLSAAVSSTPPTLSTTPAATAWWPPPPPRRQQPRRRRHPPSRPRHVHFRVGGCAPVRATAPSTRASHPSPPPIRRPRLPPRIPWCASPCGGVGPRTSRRSWWGRERERGVCGDYITASMDILQPLPGGGSGDDCEGVASASRASPEVGLGGRRTGSTVRLDQVDGLPPGPSQDRAEDAVVDHGAYNASERCKSRRSQADVMKRSCDTHAFDAVRPASDLLADAASESVIDRQSNMTARRSRKRKYTPLSVGPRTVMDVRR